MRITGTFLDEITYDIPSNNWGRAEWARDFRVMKAIGIDTVILIRAGLGKVAAMPSQVLEREVGIYPVYADLVDVFLDLAEDNGMDFYFGTYDSARYAANGDPAREVAIGKDFVDEMWARYGARKAFRGWYLTFELSHMQRSFVECLRQLGEHCKHLSPDLPNLISPYIAGPKADATHTITLEQHCADWNEILGILSGVVDVVAFQDGHVDYDVLPDFLAANSELIRKHGMRPWSNLETFDRDMPFRFPPIDWRKLWWKTGAAEQAGVEKIITFEFSHFLSPFSAWPASRNLFNRYCEHLGLNGPAITETAADDTAQLREVNS
jgi:hypothetical protein